jgi:hypothetical protein
LRVGSVAIGLLRVVLLPVDRRPRLIGLSLRALHLLVEPRLVLPSLLQVGSLDPISAGLVLPALVRAGLLDLVSAGLVLPTLVQAGLLDRIAARLILLSLITAGLVLLGSVWLRLLDLRLVLLSPVSLGLVALVLAGRLLLRRRPLTVDLQVVPRDITLLHLRISLGPIAVRRLLVDHRLGLVHLLHLVRASLLGLLRVPLRASLVHVLRVLFRTGLVSLLRIPLRLSLLGLGLVPIGTFGLGLVALVLAGLLLQLFCRGLRAVYLDIVARGIALVHLRINLGLLLGVDLRLILLSLVRLLPLAVSVRSIQRFGTGSRRRKYVGTILTVPLLPRTVLFLARLLAVVRLALELLVPLALTGFAVAFEVVGYAIAVGVAEAVDVGLLQLTIARIQDSVAVDVQRIPAVQILFELGLGVDVVAHQFLVPQGALDQAEHQHPLLVLGQVLQLGLGLRVVAHVLDDGLGHRAAFLVVELALLPLQPAIARSVLLRAVVVRRDEVVRAVERRRADRLTLPAASQQPAQPVERTPDDPRGPLEPAVQVLEQLFLDRLGLRHHATSLA